VEFRKVLALRGPNVWASFPVLEAWVDLGPYQDQASDLIPGFNDRLKAALPSLVEHRCSVGERGGFFVRLERGTYLPHILEHVSLELMCLAGTDVGFGRARAISDDGLYRVVVEYEEEGLGRAALEAGRELCLACVHDRPFDVSGTIARLREIAHNNCLGPSTRSIVDAARRRRIPCRRLNDASLVQLGWGAKQKRILASETSHTPAIAESIAQDKELTKELLRSVGVPVPDGRPVSDAEDAWAAAQEIVPPVVVKPRYGNQGRGVATNLATREQVLAAYAAARLEEETVVVEKYAPGADWRLLVVGNRVVAAARREPAQVRGDGRSTITQLIDEVNRDPRRSDGHATSLSKIPLDAVSLTVLQSQGFTPQSVPPAGQRVLIRRNANLSTGGTAADVTDQVHPDVAACAVDAARMIGLDVAGVDVVALDIGRPLAEQGGVIVEVNAGPGLRMHLEPSSGQPRAVGEAIVGTLFAEGETGRIPLVGVTGTNGKTTVTRLTAHLLRARGLAVGMACTDGIYFNERRIATGDCSGPQSAAMVLANPAVEAAVVETARGGILRAGLAFDHCDVAVVTNIGQGDHLGISGIETPEQLAWVKRTLSDSVSRRGFGVLKADDPLTAGMSPHCPGRTIFFCREEGHAVMAEHRAKGERVVFARGGNVICAEGPAEHVVAPLSDVPLTHQGRISFQVENVLAATAAAWALSVPFETIRAGLRTFLPDIACSPGRFNLLQIGETTIVVDYAHNIPALSALLGSLSHLRHEFRTVIYSAAGDRRDEDMIQQGRMLGDFFDRVILYEDQYLRGRPLGQISSLFRQGLESGGRVEDVREIRGALEAIDVALQEARPGELLLVQADKIDDTVEFVRRRLLPKEGCREIDLKTAQKAARQLVPAGGAELDE
jgi:cyanophycin synthetase